MSGIAKTINISNLSGNVNIGDAPEYQINSAINELLISLATKGSTFVRLDQRPTGEVVKKIKYNNMGSRSYIVRQYLEYSSRIEDAYIDVNALIPFGKDTILRNLNGFYFAALDEVGIDYVCGPVDMLKVRDNSIFIIDFIISKLRNFAYESMNRPALKENVELGINVVTAHAFIECVVMENPNNAP
ncbi:hypothetical protein NTD80_17025 [Pseudomonas sp. 13B_2.1_Bac1]|uniref:hypothetical protein n=1 Tax=Pseudomonas sp. 13B_2.1_Bac1 TaxID=2971624 RepID=UPI0021C9B48E|nr:hypothetical protein [Pseudomonas sp. 13B_2.1_Bac1]MCU1784457.1 hypothetical protein [Pseudomonas sp. 13B_2.1_Bac1]